VYQAKKTKTALKGEYQKILLTGIRKEQTADKNSHTCNHQLVQISALPDSPNSAIMPTRLENQGGQ